MSALSRDETVLIINDRQINYTNNLLARNLQENQFNENIDRYKSEIVEKFSQTVFTEITKILDLASNSVLYSSYTTEHPLHRIYSFNISHLDQYLKDALTQDSIIHVWLSAIEERKPSNAIVEVGAGCTSSSSSYVKSKTITRTNDCPKLNYTFFNAQLEKMLKETGANLANKFEEHKKLSGNHIINFDYYYASTEEPKSSSFSKARGAAINQLNVTASLSPTRAAEKTQMTSSEIKKTFLEKLFT